MIRMEQFNHATSSDHMEFATVNASQMLGIIDKLPGPTVRWLVLPTEKLGMYEIRMIHSWECIIDERSTNEPSTTS